MSSDWLEALRAACATSSQRLVADRLRAAGGKFPSQAVVSQALKGKYIGARGLLRLEQRVRGELMSETLRCPVLGDISKRRCQDEQQRPFAATTPQRVRLFVACKSCPNANAKAGGPS